MALVADDFYGFWIHYQYVAHFFKNADLVIGNLETLLERGHYSGYPFFNVLDNLADTSK
ncbi:MAG: CapA family protein [Candidatus Adiutrix intracellularis]|nr:CapA family protein [Candidatus Adiutrix intracellularis]